MPNLIMNISSPIYIYVLIIPGEKCRSNEWRWIKGEWEWKKYSLNMIKRPHTSCMYRPYRSSDVMTVRPWDTHQALSV